MRSGITLGGAKEIGGASASEDHHQPPGDDMGTNFCPRVPIADVATILLNPSSCESAVVVMESSNQAFPPMFFAVRRELLSLRFKNGGDDQAADLDSRAREFFVRQMAADTSERAHSSFIASTIAHSVFVNTTSHLGENMNVPSPLTLPSQCTAVRRRRK